MDPDLIWFDNLRSYGTPNYYVQQLYSLNKGTDVVPITLNNETVTGQDGCFASAVLDSKTHEVIIKIINTANRAQSSGFKINGVKGLSQAVNITTLQSDNPDAVNSLNAPKLVSPKIWQSTLKNNTVNLELKPYSFNVIKVKMAG